MRIAVVNETSAADKNIDIITALKQRGHEVLNAGMQKSGEKPELQYIHTGLISAILLKINKVDLVVGGCGTGIGYMNSVMQYPGVFCGLLHTPLDAWLFGQINDGNCISLALNQGYGWASDVNLGLIFDSYFHVQHGRGYPEHRREPQARSREMLANISNTTHKPMAEIISNLPDDIVKPVASYPGFRELLNGETAEEQAIMELLKSRL